MTARLPRSVALAAVAVVACAFARAARAQDVRDPHAAQPERPTVATHAGTVAPGWFELETGIEADHAPGARQLTTPTVLKFGLAEPVQLSVYLTSVRPADPRTYGFGDAAVGVKWRVVDDAPLVGDFAVLPAVKLPTGSAARGTGTGTTDGSLLLISSHELGPLALDINVGWTRHGSSASGPATTSTLWTISTGLDIARGLGWAAEVFGYPGTGGPAAAPASVGFLTGPTYQVHPWFVADAGIIADVRGAQAPALYAGLTWNVGRAW